MSSNFSAELHKLQTLLTYAKRGVIAIAIYDRPETRDRVIAEITDSLSRPIYKFNLDKYRRNPIDLVRQASPNPADVVCLYGIDYAMPDVLGYLDLQREVFVQFAISLVCWVTNVEHRELVAGAPNFYALRTEVFDFTNAANASTSPIKTSTGPRVFISYSHDSEEQDDRVLALADNLRADGVDCFIDEYDPPSTISWHQWITDQIAAADYVIVLCTEGYYSRTRRTDKSRRFDATWEGHIVYDAAYDSPDRGKFIPVIFDRSDANFIPRPFVGSTYFDLGLATDYHLLLQFLTDGMASGRDYKPVQLSSRKTSNVTNTGDRSVVVGGNVNGSVIITGGGNSVRIGGGGRARDVKHVNPFTWREPLTSVEAFFDRSSEQRLLEAYLRQHQSCQIVGPRRIGKSSLLLQIARMAPIWQDNARVAFLDMQDPRNSYLPGFLNSVKRAFGWTTPRTDLEGFVDNVGAMAKKGLRPVLCLDEFEAIADIKSEFGPAFFSTLRATSRWLTIFASSTTPLAKIEPYTVASPLFNIFASLRLDVFSDADARAFVSQNAVPDQRFTASETTAILNLAKGHPLALQVACFHVLEGKYEGEPLSSSIARAGEEIQTLIPELMPV